MWNRKDTPKGAIYSLDMKQFIPLLKLKREIEKIKKIDTNSIRIDYLTHLIMSLCNERELHYNYLIDPTPLFRGRIFHPKEVKIKNKRDLWYPPKNKISKYGRINDIGQQIFYCASSLLTVLFELNPKINDYIGLIQCNLNKNYSYNIIKLVKLGISSELLKKYRTPQNIIDSVAKLDKKNKSNLVINDIPINDLSESNIIHAFFHEQFSKIIAEDCSHDYKMTIAIANLWFQNNEVSGIVYPTISSYFQEYDAMVGYNAAFKKDVIDKYYNLEKVWIAKVNRLTNKGFELEILQFSNDIKEDGEIIWSNEIQDIPQ